MKLGRERKYALALIALHVSMMIALLLVIIIMGGDYHEILLHDDGYYRTAGRIVRGESIDSMYGLGYPMILTVLYVFPRSLHPFLRLMISMLFTGFTVLLIFKIYRNYLTEKEIFLGALFFVLNPLYVHWMFKSRVEAPLVLLLGLVILYTQEYLKGGKAKHLIYAGIALAFGIFTKPIFMLVPLSILFAGVCIRSRQTILVAIIFGFVAIGSFIGTKRVIDSTDCSMQYYKIHNIVGSSFYVDAIVRRMDFKTQYMYLHDEEGNYIRNPELVPGDEWIREYENKYGNQNPILMSLRFMYEKPLLVLQQISINPFLVMSLSSTEWETFFHLVINFSLLVVSILGIRGVQDKSYALYIHLAAVFSVYALLVMIHSRGPYFIPIVPYLFVFAGGPTNKLMLAFRKVVGR